MVSFMIDLKSITHQNRWLSKSVHLWMKLCKELQSMSASISLQSKNKRAVRIQRVRVKIQTVEIKKLRVLRKV